MPISIAAKAEYLKQFNQIMKDKGWTGLETEYINHRTPMRFICDKGHQASMELRVLARPTGNGCTACRKTNKWTIEQFREVASKRSWQLLSENVVNTKTKATYQCDKGHVVEMYPERVHKNAECYECANIRKKAQLEKEAARKPRCKKNKSFLDLPVKESVNPYNRVDFSELISKLENKGYKLDFYSGTINKPSKVTCNEGHTRSTTVDAILKEKLGCPECLRLADKIRFAEFCKEVCFKVVGEYQYRTKPVEVICNIGHSTKIDLISLKRGRGCPVCKATPKKKDSEVISTFGKEGYNWVSGNYDSAFSKLLVECPQGHKTFMTLHSFISSSTRCSGCRVTGFDQSKPGILYYIRFDYNAKFYYKIGITNLSVAIRFRDEKTPYKIIRELYYEWGAEALQEETKILRQYKKYKYLGYPFLVSGNSELFDKDVLLLDQEQIQATYAEELA